MPLLDDSLALNSEAEISKASRPRHSNHRRSATWDDNEGLASRVRRSGSFRSFQSIEGPILQSTTPRFVPLEQSLPEDDSAQSKTGQASVGYAAGKSLFEEFKQMGDDNTSTPSTSDVDSTPPQKHLGSPYPSFLVESTPLPSLQEDIDPSQSLPIQSPEPPGQGTTTGSGRLHLVAALATAVSRSLDRRAPIVRQIFGNAWDIVTLSRPVLEFRWWLIKLLIGDLRKRHKLWPTLSPARKARTPQATTEVAKPELSPAEYSAHALEDVLTHLDKVKAEEEELSPARPPPPLYWIRFGLTLVFAVGIALKDGPSRLLIPRRVG